jgi:hypothetical protein
LTPFAGQALRARHRVSARRDARHDETNSCASTSVTRCRLDDIHTSAPPPSPRHGGYGSPDSWGLTDAGCWRAFQASFMRG